MLFTLLTPNALHNPDQTTLFSVLTTSTMIGLLNEKLMAEGMVEHGLVQESGQDLFLNVDKIADC